MRVSAELEELLMALATEDLSIVVPRCGETIALAIEEGLVVRVEGELLLTNSGWIAAGELIRILTGDGDN